MNLSKINLICSIIITGALVFIVLNLTFSNLNQRVILNNFGCSRIHNDIVINHRFDKGEEYCNCLYRSYELANNPFMRFWGKIYDNVEPEEWLILSEKCKVIYGLEDDLE